MRSSVGVRLLTIPVIVLVLLLVALLAKEQSHLQLSGTTSVPSSTQVERASAASSEQQVGGLRRRFSRDLLSAETGRPAFPRPTPDVAQNWDATVKKFWEDAGVLEFDDYAMYWAAERHDKDWSSNVESYVYAMLGAEDLELDLVRFVDCRQTLCRLELSAADANMRALFRLSSGLRGDGYPFVRRVAAMDGGNTVVAFIARDGLEEKIFPAEPEIAHGADAG